MENDEQNVTDPEIPDEENDGESIAEPTKKPVKVPSLFHNYISFAGAAIGVACLVSIVLLFMIEMSGSSDQPYLGILIYVMLPGVMLFGLFVAIVGMLIERFRRRKKSPEEIAAYPILDLNGPKRRRAFIIFLVSSFVFLFMSAFGSYRAYEFSESVTFCGEVCHTVMKPEFVAYNASAHAKVRCVDCHVGGGAEWYLRSKFTGVRQLYRVLTDSYSKPIKTPVHNMRPANDTCGKCHWSEKFYGDQLKVFNHYGFDEENSLNQTRLLVKVGGGSTKTGNASGIHWHMNSQNEISYVSVEDKREDIVWVSMKDKTGKIIEFTRQDSKLSPQKIAQSSKRKMDCIDCHNRPTHVFVSPTKAVDDSLTAGSIDASLPFIKRKTVEVLTKEYSTNEEALSNISSSLDDYYKTNYADLYRDKRTALNKAIVETQRIYSTYFFPEMKTNWQSHPDNIGHLNTQGCFRCHNDSFSSKEGLKIRTDCSICHTTIDQTFKGTTIRPENGEFQHPANIGEINKLDCSTCHTGDRAFKHPLNLGDISRFQCVECHKNGFEKFAVK